MRITIIPGDGFVSIDGVGYLGIDLSAIEKNISAIQWYDTDGEIEIKNDRGHIVENRAIASLSDFDFVIPLWESAKADAQAKLAKQSQA